MFGRSNSLTQGSRVSARTEYQPLTTADTSSSRNSGSDRLCLSKLDNETFGEVLILGSLLFFGISFSCQKKAMINGMGPLTYNAGRYVISTLFLGAYLLLTRAPIRHGAVTAEHSSNSVPFKETLKQLLWWGGWLGLANLGGSTGQQIGLVSVTAGKTGFITGMYVIFVPIVEYFFPCFHMKLHWSTLAAAITSLGGLYLLSGCAEQETCFGGALGEGEAYVFLSMLFWVASIILSDVAAKQLDGVWITFVEFSLTTIVTIGIAMYYEPQEWVYPFVNAQKNWDMMVIVGFTEAVAFALSTLGQTFSSPSRAALLFSLEAVVCAVIAYYVLDETLTWIEILGGFLMFAAALGTSIVVIEDELEEEELQLHHSEPLHNSDDRRPILVEYTGFGSVEMTKSTAVTHIA